LVGAASAVCIAGSACASSAVPARSSGCREEVHGIAGKIFPETSGLSCAQIKKLIEVRPSGSRGFVAIGEHPRGLWRCQVHRPDKTGVLLRCTRRRQRFSVVEA
jgi:hypothetical protein